MGGCLCSCSAWIATKPGLLTKRSSYKKGRAHTQMKITYTSECEEMAGTVIEVPDHACRDNMIRRESHHVETHGLDCGPYENFDDIWYECSLCGEIDEEQN